MAHRGNPVPNSSGDNRAFSTLVQTMLWLWWLVLNMMNRPLWSGAGLISDGMRDAHGCCRAAWHGNGYQLGIRGSADRRRLSQIPLTLTGPLRIVGNPQRSRSPSVTAWPSGTMRTLMRALGGRHGRSALGSRRPFQWGLRTRAHQAPLAPILFSVPFDTARTPPCGRIARWRRTAESRRFQGGARHLLPGMRDAATLPPGDVPRQ
jgi:hypothetical protein